MEPSRYRAMKPKPLCFQTAGKDANYGISLDSLGAVGPDKRPFLHHGVFEILGSLFSIFGFGGVLDNYPPCAIPSSRFCKALDAKPKY